MFYSVIETRDFSLFNQSAQALLKGYFGKISKHHEYYYSIIVRGTSHDYLFITSMTKLDTSQCQHHILSPKPSPARLSNNNKTNNKISNKIHIIASP